MKALGAQGLTWKGYLSVLAHCQVVDNSNHHFRMLFDLRPARCFQDRDSNPSLGEVLLIPEALVGRHQQFKARRFRGFEQFTVGQALPASLVCRLDNM